MDKIKISNLYSDTNRSLFSILGKSISEERKEISKLVKEERNLRSKVETESRRIKTGNLKEKKTVVKRRINANKNKLQDLRQAQNNKEKSLKKAVDTITALKNEATAKVEERVKLEKQLQIKLQQFVNHQKREAGLTKNEKKRLNLKINKVRKEKNDLFQQLEKAKKLIENQLAKELHAFNECKRLELHSHKEAIAKEDHNILLLEKRKKQVMLDLAASIKRDLAVLQKKETKLKEDLKRKGPVSGRISELRKRINQLENNSNVQINGLNELKEQILELKKKSKRLQNKLRNKRFSIQEQKNMKIKNSQQTRDEINKIIREYNQKVKLLGKERGNFSNKIRLLESKRKQSLERLKKSNSSLETIKKEMSNIENIEKSLTDVRRQLVDVASKEGKIQAEKQNKIIGKQLGLSKRIGEVSKSQAKEQGRYNKQLHRKKELSRKIKLLERKQDSVLTKINESKKLLTKAGNHISVEKIKHQNLIEEEELLKNIVNKIELESKIKKSILRKPVYDRLDNYIIQLQDEVKSNTWKKIKNVDKQIELEKEKQKRIQADLRRKNIQLEKNLENEKVKLKQKQGRENKQAGLKIASLDKDIAAVGRKKVTANRQLDRKKVEIEAEMDAKKKEFSTNRLKLLEKAKSLKRRKYNISKKTATNEKVLRKLREDEKELEERQEKIKENHKLISEKLSGRDKDLKELNKIAKIKIKRINEANKLRDELHKLHLVIDEKLPLIKIKTRIVQVIKIKTRIVKEIKRIRVKVKSNIDVDKDLKPALRKIDGLLGKLSPKDIKAFSKSKDFQIYKKIMTKYGIK